MIKIGCINKLTIKRTRDFGAHLDGGEAGDILLPKKYVSETYRPGDEVEVFVYADKEGRLRATTMTPSVTVGQFAKLRVVKNTPSGAYLDWGLQKDLLVPHSEQQVKMEQGKSYVVYVFLDKKNNRITASSKLDKFLNQQAPNYLPGEDVDLLICDKTDLGYKAIVNNSHWGMIYKNEVFQKIDIGQRLKGYIKTIREDLKVDISLQQAGYQKVADISQDVLKKINDLGGSIAITDKSPPEEIYSMFGMSKKTFKKAIGALYKKRLITIDANGVKLVKKNRTMGAKPPGRSPSRRKKE
ncbi:MAG: GntR family transcriptional regulator [Desulfobulbaceae bacterium]|nr:GntR family transcriptional regulator [Desulfobulbaceae bacterium]